MTDFNLFLICFLIGLGLGLVYGILGFIKLLIKNNIVISNILNFVYAISCGFVVLFTTIQLNYGQFRWFLMAGFLIGIITERKTLGKIFAKFFLWLYNKLSKCQSALKNTKVVKKILK